MFLGAGPGWAAYSRAVGPGQPWIPPAPCRFCGAAGRTAAGTAYGGQQMSVDRDCAGLGRATAHRQATAAPHLRRAGDVNFSRWRGGANQETGQ
jgi:hypothetical protein